jgi:hypothetical protein
MLRNNRVGLHCALAGPCHVTHPSLCKGFWLKGACLREDVGAHRAMKTKKQFVKDTAFIVVVIIVVLMTMIMIIIIIIIIINIVNAKIIMIISIIIAMIIVVIIITRNETLSLLRACQARPAACHYQPFRRNVEPLIVPFRFNCEPFWPQR